MPGAGDRNFSIGVLVEEVAYCDGLDRAGDLLFTVPDLGEGVVRMGKCGAWTGCIRILKDVDLVV